MLRIKLSTKLSVYLFHLKHLYRWGIGKRSSATTRSISIVVNSVQVHPLKPQLANFSRLRSIKYPVRNGRLKRYRMHWFDIESALNQRLFDAFDVFPTNHFSLDRVPHWDFVFKSKIQVLSCSKSLNHQNFRYV